MKIVSSLMHGTHFLNLLRVILKCFFVFLIYLKCTQKPNQNIYCGKGVEKPNDNADNMIF